MKVSALLLGLLLVSASFSLGALVATNGRAQGETVLVIAQQSDPGILNNIVGDTLGSFFIHHMVWSELFHLSYDQSGISTEIGLAQGWDISPDGLNYTIHLRPGVKWHDGVPFTAEDVKFTFEAAIALPTWAIAWLRTIDRITVNDPYNVTFTLTERDAAFLPLLAFGSDFGLNILPKHLYEGTNIATNPNNFAPIGTGPFKYVSNVPGQSITLEANPDHWAGRPSIDRVVIKIIPNSATAAQELQAGTIQYLTTFDNPLAFAQLPPIVASPGVSITTPKTGVIIWLLFNTRDPVVGNATLRQALGHAVNRSEIAEKAYFDFASPMQGFFLEGPWFNSNAQLPYDPARAIQLLNQLGYTPDTNGVRLTLDFAFHPLFGMDVGAQVVKEQLAQVGVVINFWSADYATWFDKVHVNGDYQVALRASQIGPDPAIMWQWLDPTHQGESGSTYFNDTTMVNLFLQARQETNQAQRKAMYDQVQQILRDNVPVLPLTNIQDANLWRSDMVDDVGADVGTNRWDFSQAKLIAAAPVSLVPLYAAAAIVVAAIGAIGLLLVRRRRRARSMAREDLGESLGEEQPPKGEPPGG